MLGRVLCTILLYQVLLISLAFARQNVVHINDTTVDIGVFMPLSVNVFSTSTSFNPAYAGINYACKILNSNGNLLGNRAIIPRLVDSGLSYEVAAFTLPTLSNTTMIIGPGVTTMAEYFGAVTEVYGINSITFVSTSEIDDRVRFSRFFSLLPSPTSDGQRMAELVAYFGWTRTALLTMDDDDSVAFLLGFLSKSSTLGINVISSQVYVAQITAYSAQLLSIQSSGALIIIFCAPVQYVTAIYYAAINLGMMGAGTPYTWVTCVNGVAFTSTTQQFDHAIDGLVAVAPITSEADLTFYPTGLGSLGISQSVADLSNVALQQVNAAIFEMAYDALMMSATAIGSLYKLKSTCSSNPTSANSLSVAAGNGTLPVCSQLALENDDDITMTRLLNSEVFYGPSGPLLFSASGTVNTPYEIIQCNFDPTSASLIWSPRLLRTPLGAMTPVSAFQWNDGTSDTPLDHPQVITNILGVSYTDFVIVSAFCGFAMSLALVCLGVNFFYRNHPVIKLSAPRINAITIVGAILVLVFPIIFGLNPTNGSCAAQSWIAPIGFTLLFGSMFSKTFRIYRIFNARQIKQVRISDWQLLKVILVMLTLDVILLSIWQSQGSIQARLQVVNQSVNPNLVTQVSEDLAYTCYGSQDTTWISILLAYKGIMLLVGTWITYETRKATVAQILHDSKWIGMCIYTTTLIMTVIIPVFIVVKNLPAVLFNFAAGAIILATLMILGFLFVPKIVSIWKGYDIGEVIPQFQGGEASMKTYGMSVNSDSAATRGPQLLQSFMIQPPPSPFNASNAPNSRRTDGPKVTFQGGVFQPTSRTTCSSRMNGYLVSSKEDVEDTQKEAQIGNSDGKVIHESAHGNSGSEQAILHEVAEATIRLPNQVYSVTRSPIEHGTAAPAAPAAPAAAAAADHENSVTRSLASTGLGVVHACNSSVDPATTV